MSKTAAALAILAFAMSATLAALAVASPAAAEHAGRVDVAREDGRTTIRVEGVITEAVAAAFLGALDAAPGGAVEIELDSPGGFVRAGYAMVDAILGARAAGRRVSTLVRGRAACESMCVGVFMSGLPRRAEPGATFMVHAPRNDLTGAVSLRASAVMKARLVSLGVSEGWVARAESLGAFSGALDYRRDAETLAGDGSNVVTHLVAAPWAGVP